MFCSECGRKVSETAIHCPECGVKLKWQDSANESYQSESNNNYNNYYEKQYEKVRAASNNVGRQTIRPVNSGFPLTLSDGEKLVRSYACCRSRMGFYNYIPGHLHITNKRVVFNATESVGKSRVTSEVTLDTISGIDSSYGTNYNILRILIGALIVIVALYLCISGYNVFGYGNIGVGFQVVAFVVAIIGAVIIVSGVQSNFKLIIYSSQATGAPISIGVGATSLAGNQAMETLQGVPYVDTDIMLNELGAMIMDLKEKGDYAIEKWGTK